VSQYLEGLAAAIRAAGCTVVELPGWQTRGRSGNAMYADGRPWCVMWHHTASAGDGADDADYCTFRSPDAPLANLVVGRDGVVYVCAAGPTNTNGKGGPLTFSRGTVPVDSMNTHAVGIEISNDGVGMPYPVAQINACFAASNAVCAAYGLEPDDIDEHVDWAPGRKIDPATSTAVQGEWQPEPVNTSLSWWAADLRAEARRRATTTPPPPHPTGEVTMYVIAVIRNGWPTPVDLVVAADGTRWNANGHTSGLDQLAGVPRIEGVGKEQALGVLIDRPGIGPHPFDRPEYADAELSAAW
jgi:hypothetical protein